MNGKLTASHAFISGLLALRKKWISYLLLGIVLTFVNALIAFASLGQIPTESDLPSNAALGEGFRRFGVIIFSLVGSSFQGLFVLAIYSVAITVALSNARHLLRGPSWWPSAKVLSQVTFGGVVIILLASGCFAALFSGGVALASLSGQVIWIGIGVVIGGAVWISVINGTSMFGFLIIDRKISTLSSLWRSWKVVSPHFRSLLGLNAFVFAVSSFAIGASLVAALSLSPLLLSVLLPPTIGFSLGLYTCSMACAYENLEEESSSL